MDHTELRGLFDHPGPFVSAYLDLDGRGEDAQRHRELRWHGLRQRLVRSGAAEPAALAVVDDAVASADPGDAFLGVVAVPGRAVLHRRLTGRLPRGDRAGAGPLPGLVPLLEWHQGHPRHLLVVVDRAGADVVAFGQNGEAAAGLEVVGGNDEIERNAPGGWSQRRYQHRAEDSWERNAAQVADVVAKVTDRLGPRLVLVAGDVRARQYLLEHLAARVMSRVSVLETGGSRQPDGSEHAHREQATRHVAAVLRHDEEELLGRFTEERGQQDRATDGLEGTVAALAQGKVGTLLLVDDPGDGRRAWFAGQPTAVATRPDDLAALGLAPVEAALPDVLVRAALGTGAAVHVLDPTRAEAPRDGVGALLRFP